MARLILALSLVVLLFGACGEDENPVAVDDPCNDAGTTCLTVTLASAGISYYEYYDAFYDLTTHGLSWDVGSLVIPDYAPGQRIMITVVFNPPLEVRHNHPNQHFSLGAGVTGGVIDRFASSTSGIASDDWAVIQSDVSYSGQSGTGASRFQVSAILGPLVVGQRLERLAFDFVVPETYTSGGSSGTAILPGDLDVVGLGTNTENVGDTTGDPPIWQGAFEPTVNR